jgi:ADP-ribose pyrophosphatase YjhB (NUDIX family)
MTKKRLFCPYCSHKISSKKEGDIIRDYCVPCDTFFYDNPLPVVSNIVVKERKLLLVKRKFEPHIGEWCLPSGFAENNESIQEAALRELEEEAGIVGRIIDFVCVDSAINKLYGDLIFVTFESEWIEGDLLAGDDAEEVRFFPFENLPPLAFESNTKAVRRYINGKKEFWDIVDSFSLSVRTSGINTNKGNYVSDKLITLIENNAEIIANRWLQDVCSNKSTPTYSSSDQENSLQRNLIVISQFGKWLGGFYTDIDIRKYYRNLGSARKSEGFALSEVLSAISLTRKYIWEFALSQRMWTSTIDIYMTLELERRMMLFFDRASFYVARGFEAEDKP